MNLIVQWQSSTELDHHTPSTGCDGCDQTLYRDRSVDNGKGFENGNTVLFREVEQQHMSIRCASTEFRSSLLDLSEV